MPIEPVESVASSSVESPSAGRAAALRRKMLRGGPVPLAAGVIVFALVSGSSGAVAGRLITGEDIKNRSISNRDLATNAVNSRIVADGSLESRDLSRATLRALTPATPAPGAPGSAWLSGAGAPTSVDANDGDWYFDTETSQVYTRVGGAWGFVVDLTGAQGVQGVQGLQGVQGEKGETGAQGIQGEKGDQGLKGDTGAAGKDGLDGKDGTVWSSGAGAPSPSLGVVGDWYLDSETADAYQKTAPDAWTKRVNLRGAKGEKGDKGATGEQGVAGIDGASWFTGAGAPASALGDEGDLYLDTETGDVFKRVGVWSKLTNIRGLRGDPGKNGENGTNGKDGKDGAAGAAGANGTVWLTGADAPSSSQGSDGDLYLRTSNGDVFKKSSGAWGTAIANLTGPAGPKGADGAAGSGASGSVWYTGAGAPSPQTSNPVAGGLYLDTSSGEVYKANGTTWTSIYTPATSGVKVLVEANTSGQTPQGSLPVATQSPVAVSFGNVVSGSAYWNGTTFTAPSEGYYQVEAQVLAADASPASSTVPPFLQVDVNNDINGSRTIVGIYPTLHNVVGAPGWRGVGRLSALVKLDAGETIKINGRSANSSTASQPIRATPATFLTIAKVS